MTDVTRRNTYLRNGFDPSDNKTSLLKATAYIIPGCKNQARDQADTNES